MKSFHLVFFICFVQICTSASIGKTDDDSLSGFDVDEILSHKNEWKADSDVNQQAVDNLVNILKNFNENSKGNELAKGFMDLMNIVLNKDVAEDKQVKLQFNPKNTDKSNDDVSSEEIIVRLGGEQLPEDSSELDKVLTEKLNDSQKAQVLKYFKGIQADKSVEIAYVLIDLIKDAIIATLGDKYTFKGNEVVLKAVDGNQK